MKDRRVKHIDKTTRHMWPDRMVGAAGGNQRLFHSARRGGEVVLPEPDQPLAKSVRAVNCPRQRAPQETVGIGVETGGPFLFGMARLGRVVKSEVPARQSVGFRNPQNGPQGQTRPKRGPRVLAGQSAQHAGNTTGLHSGIRQAKTETGCEYGCRVWHVVHQSVGAGQDSHPRDAIQPPAR